MEKLSNYRGVDLDLAIGTAGARVAELIRSQSDAASNADFVRWPDETMLSNLVSAAGTRLDPEQYHNNREVMDEAVFNVAVKADFVKPEVYTASNGLEAALGIHSDPERYDGEVEAIIVPGAAGLSNLKRLYHALNAVETGAVQTGRIIIAAGQRSAPETEQAKLTAAGFMPGESEYEICQNAVEELIGQKPQESRSIPMSYGGRNFEAKVSTVEDWHSLRIDVVEAPFDPERKLPNGASATRVNTEETFIPLRSMLSENGPLYVVSHDTWQPVQELIAYRMFPEHFIVGSGPQNLERVTRDETTGKLKLNGASGVQDEMKKYLQELAKIHPLTKE